ncbi:hypothetical protein HY612_00845 [Candidatus Roizmanbacteria bacterium]|nr:hypothetical protein [Candidatus Roizmanbacteria bacterium]
MNKDDLDKIIRIAEGVRNLCSTALKDKNQGSRLTGFSHSYRKYRDLLTPIFLRYIQYQLEFLAIPKGEEVSFNQIIPSLVMLKSFLDAVIRQEILDSRQELEQFKKEFFIDDNKTFSAYKTISDIVSKAVTDLKLIDNYIESNSLDFFLDINTKVNVKIISMKLIPNANSFRIVLEKFIKQWGGVQFEVRITSYFHDRYIILDNKEVWHLGPSLNRLGIKPAMISSITDEEVIKHIIDIFDKQWNIASQI